MTADGPPVSVSYAVTCGIPLMAAVSIYRLRVHVLNGNHICASQVLKFREEIIKQILIESCRTDIILLLEARQGCRVITGDPQQTIGEHTLHIVDVTNHLFDRPFLRCGPEAGLCIRQSIQRGVKFIDFLVSNRIKTFVHCKNGHGRAPTLVAAYFISRGMGVQQAVDTIAAKRPVIHFTEAQMRALDDFKAAMVRV